MADGEGRRAAARLRPATPADAVALAAVHHDAREQAMPWLPRLHPREETRAWFTDVVLPSQVVTVAEEGGRVVARARAFYERAGFVLVGTSDGSTTEEGEPDATYAWSPG
ncbi:hypothetical protein [uncultured Pseudokineococcus sp.]|uniref:GNAT family N-acetyltransferase n=1 Tax=uncultured Pseudokineococcus sp. TaxID=1642928 RepID=UPI002633250D|nr:hypothetical protein [uncultured Pseudokineococcus sp.]